LYERQNSQILLRRFKEMIDLHSHFLPCMDDGSQSTEESLAMLRESAMQGVSVIAATPHFYPDRESPESFLKRRDEAFRKLAPLEDCPEILLGAEVGYFRGISRCDCLQGLNIEGTSLILLELPFEPWSSAVIEDVCAIKKLTGYTPVLAHFERYRRYDGFSDNIKRLVSGGALLQCNAESFISGIYSRKAIKLLRSGEIAFVGSDCHGINHRAPNMAAAANKIPQIAGICISQYLTEKH